MKYCGPFDLHLRFKDSQIVSPVFCFKILAKAGLIFFAEELQEIFVLLVDAEQISFLLLRVIKDIVIFQKLSL